MRTRSLGFLAALLVGTSAAAYAGLASIPVGNIVRPLVQSTIFLCQTGTKLPPSYCGPLVGERVSDLIGDLRDD